MSFNHNDSSNESSRFHYLKDGSTLLEYSKSLSLSNGMALFHEQLEQFVQDHPEYEPTVFSNSRLNLIRYGKLFLVLMVLVMLFILTVTATFLQYPSSYSTWLQGHIVRSVLFILVNGCVICRLHITQKSLNRYQVYYILLQIMPFMSIDEASDFLALPQKSVIRDLRTYIKAGLIPEGQFCYNNLAFVTSDAVAHQYLSTTNLYESLLPLQKEREQTPTTSQMQQFMTAGQSLLSKLSTTSELAKNRYIDTKIAEITTAISLLIYKADIHHEYVRDLRYLLDDYSKMISALLGVYISPVFSNNLALKKDIDLANSLFYSIFGHYLMSELLQ